MPGRVFNHDVALYMSAHGYDAAVEHFAITIKPARARDIMRILVSANTPVPDELKELAEKVRPSNHRTMPVPGEERKVKATKNGRVSVNAEVIGIKRGTAAKVKYQQDKIVVTKER